MMGSPETSRPRAKASLDFDFLKMSERSIFFIPTNSGARLGISIPTRDLPGIGASIRIWPVGAARARARSF